MEIGLKSVSLMPKMCFDNVNTMSGHTSRFRSTVLDLKVFKFTFGSKRQYSQVVEVLAKTKMDYNRGLKKKYQTCIAVIPLALSYVCL